MTDLEAIKYDCNKPKRELTTLQYSLNEKGFFKQAKQLEKIIEKLEAWQNK